MKSTTRVNDWNFLSMDRVKGQFPKIHWGDGNAEASYVDFWYEDGCKGVKAAGRVMPKKGGGDVDCFKEFAKDEKM